MVLQWKWLGSHTYWLMNRDFHRDSTCYGVANTACILQISVWCRYYYFVDWFRRYVQHPIPPRAITSRITTTGAWKLIGPPCNQPISVIAISAIAFQYSCCYSIRKGKQRILLAAPWKLDLILVRTCGFGYAGNKICRFELSYILERSVDRPYNSIQFSRMKCATWVNGGDHFTVLPVTQIFRRYIHGK